jgi:two-component system, cell cycle sensor histidine kinase and response regulator CckA
MHGPELADRLRTLYPDVPVLFVSGYTEDAVIRGGIRAENTDFLAKPFAPSTLIDRIRLLLAPAAASD